MSQVEGPETVVKASDDSDDSDDELGARSYTGMMRWRNSFGGEGEGEGFMRGRDSKKRVDNMLDGVEASGVKDAREAQTSDLVLDHDRLGAEQSPIGKVPSEVVIVVWCTCAARTHPDVVL